MSTPQFSVIIPVYNRQREVRRAVESCLAQGMPDFDVVVVDDGSTDRSADVIKSLDDPRISIVRHGVNRGDGPARNTGVRHAKGEWIVFLDSDDELLPGALSTVAARVATCGVDIGRAGFCYALKDGGISPDPPLPGPVVDYDAHVRWTGTTKTSDFLQCVRKDTFERVRFAESRADPLQYHLDFAQLFRTRAFPDVVARLHSDAGNRLSDWLSNSLSEGHRSQRASDQADSLARVIRMHGDTIRKLAPGSLQTYSAARALYTIVGGPRWRGLALGVGHLADYPFSTRSWKIAAFGLVGPAALGWGVALKARCSTSSPRR